MAHPWLLAVLIAAFLLVGALSAGGVLKGRY